MSPNIVSIDALPPGATGVIERLDDSGPIGRRLLELGFVPGTPVHVVRRAPLGDPTVYALRGTRMCLRRTEAARIWVQRQDAEGGTAVG